MVNACLIPFGGLLLLFGRPGDLAGRKRTFTAGLAVFTAASVACGPATSQGALITARAGQGAGGAVVSGAVLGTLVSRFPEPREQPRAVAAFGATGSLGPVGATVGHLPRRRTGAGAEPALNPPGQSADRRGDPGGRGPDPGREPGAGLGRGASRGASPTTSVRTSRTHPCGPRPTPERSAPAGPAPPGCPR
ncbi:MFS transporter [Streptomyces sp. NPDC086519]|uniref:MFS transporter n=1 Tax=Streptomyces sp. NPDC086519 TaxID=3154863 RepID=UPI00343C4CDB